MTYALPSITTVALGALMNAATCSRVTPPPLATPFEGTMRDPLHSTSVAGYGGVGATGGGIAGGDITGGAGVRVSHQLDTNVSVGLEGTAVTRVRRNNPDVRNDPNGFDDVAAGRLHVRAHPGIDRLAFTFGVGGGATNNSLQYMTLDGGLRLSAWSTEHVELYLGGLLAASIPTRQAMIAGDPAYRTTVFTGGNVGIVFRPFESLAIGADLGALGYSYDDRYEWTMSVIGSLRYIIAAPGARRTQ